MIFLIFALVLGVLVFIHEFGHFSAAKLLGVRVEKFSLGLPPTLIRLFKKGDTEYLISWIPFGGYVKLAGENPDEKLTGAEYELASKPAWIRFIIFFAGVFMNFVLGFIIFSMVMWLHGSETFPMTPISTIETNSIAQKFDFQAGDKIISINGKKAESWDQVMDIFYSHEDKKLDVAVERAGGILNLSYTITESDSLKQKGVGFIALVGTTIGGVQKDSPADKIGLKRGDVVVAIDGKPVSMWQDMTEIIYNKPNEVVLMEWERNGQRMKSEVIPKEKLAPDDEQFGQTKKVGMIGVRSYQVTQRENLFDAIKTGFLKSILYMKFIFVLLGMLIGGKVPANTLGGPITVYQAVGESFQWGWAELMNFMGIFSVNLAVLNILPIPALDGGHIFLLIIETIKRGPLNAKAKLVWQQAGFIFLIVLMFFATYNDIVRAFFK